jgi:hypothetical protein
MTAKITQGTKKYVGGDTFCLEYLYPDCPGALEYNTTNTEPDNELDHYVNTLQRSNEDYDSGINAMFLNILDPTFYAIQMQNSHVLAHAQMKRQVDAKKIIEAQRLEIEGLMDIKTFEFTPKTKLPAKTRYLDLIWTNR